MKNKYVVLFCSILFFVTCNSKDANDCFQTTGAIVQTEFSLDSFEEVIVNERIELFIKESLEQKVIVETGENLLSDIKLTVKDNQLSIQNYNECNFVRDFGVTKVYVYTPNLTKIRNSSSLPIKSVGVLNFDSLELISENYLSNYLSSGDFNLELNTQNLKIIANGPSNHTIRGFSTNLNINFAGNDPRFEGEDLLVKKAFLLTKSSNDILIKATDEVSGDLYSTGDVILLKEPTVMNLNAHYTGRVIHNY